MCSARGAQEKGHVGYGGSGAWSKRDTGKEHVMEGSMVKGLHRVWEGHTEWQGSCCGSGPNPDGAGCEAGAVVTA